jgi:hypothetical protein
MPQVKSAGAVQTVNAVGNVLAGNDYACLPGGVVIDATASYDGAHTGFETTIRAGWLLAKVTSSNKYTPVKRTQANGAGSAVAALIVDNAAAFKVGDAITVAATSATTVSAVNYSTNTITLAATKTWSDNAVVIGGAAGAETATCVLGEDVVLYDNDTMTNIDTTAGCVYIRGLLNSPVVRGDLAAVRAISGNLITKNFDVFPTDV